MRVNIDPCFDLCNWLLLIFHALLIASINNRNLRCGISVFFLYLSFQKQEIFDKDCTSSHQEQKMFH